MNINSDEYLVFEYCSGGSLLDLTKSFGTIQPPKLYKYCFQILSAIQYLHQKKIAHLNLTPSSVLLTSDDKIKLTNFGLSQEITPKKKIKLSGPELFMPPEYWHKTDRFDPFLVDVYSLGITFYYISQGKHPFNARTRQELENKVCAEAYEPLEKNDLKFREMVCHMICGEATERPQISQLMSNPIFQNFRETNFEKSGSFAPLKRSIPQIYSTPVVHLQENNGLHQVDRKSDLSQKKVK